MATFSSRKLELSLLAFGLLLGLLCAGGLYLYLNRMHAGRDFASLNDLRRTMLESSGPTAAGRNVDLRELLNPHPDDFIIYDLRPNLDVLFQDVSVKTNSCGMRERQLPFGKANDTYRIAVLGDSFAFGWGVDEDKAFPRVLERLLNDRSTGQRYEVLNFGVPGYSTFQEVALFREKALDFNPDAVLVYFVENDFGLPFFVRDLNNDDSLMPGNVLARLSWGDTEPRAKAEVRRQNRFNADRSLQDLAALTQREGIPVFVAINPRSRWKEDYSRLQGTRSSPGITLINMWPDFIRIVESRGYKSEQLTLPTDPHPTALKHSIYAEVLAPYVLSLTVKD